jgi:AcrR family transcriptional regulator
MTSNFGRPAGVDSAETRRNILEIAYRQFATGGYALTTMKDVAAEAGITSGAIYHYFPSKAALFAATAAHAHAILQDFNREHALSVSDLPMLERALSLADALVKLADTTNFKFFMNMELDAYRNDTVAPISEEILQVARAGLHERYFGDDVEDSNLTGDGLVAFTLAFGFGLTRLLVADPKLGHELARLAVQTLRTLLELPASDVPASAQTH